MKNSKKLLALLMALAMVFALCACSGNAAKAVMGEWNASIDMTDYINQELENQGMDTTGNDTKFSLAVIVKLNEDGSCRLKIDTDKTDDSFSEYMSSLAGIMTDAVYAQIAAENNMTNEEVDAIFTAQYNMTVAEYCQSAIASISLSDMIDEDSLSEKGYYKVEDGKIFFAEDKDDFDEDNYVEYTVDGDKLTVTGIGEDADDYLSDFDEFCPIVLEK